MRSTTNHRVESLLAAIRDYHRTRRSAQVYGDGIIVRDRAVIKTDLALMEAIIAATDEDVDAVYSGAAPCDDAVTWASSKRAAEKIRRWARIAPEAVAELIAAEREKLA